MRLSQLPFNYNNGQPEVIRLASSGTGTLGGSSSIPNLEQFKEAVKAVGLPNPPWDGKEIEKNV